MTDYPINDVVTSLQRPTTKDSSSSSPRKAESCSPHPDSTGSSSFRLGDTGSTSPLSGSPQSFSPLSSAESFSPRPDTTEPSLLRLDKPNLSLPRPDAPLSSLPRPIFYDQLQPPLSTKREKEQKGIKRRAPRVVRSVQTISRFSCERHMLHGPQLISKSKIGFDTTNSVYDKNDSRDYFEQCFIKERKIGEGSFGEVFRVKSKIDGEYYAVKRTIEPFRSLGDREMKVREVHMHEFIPKHPNLVEFKCAWEERGQLYIQTELCQYSLADYAERVHNIPEEELWGYFADLVSAVSHLHEHDLLHLDIKPENILISKNICKLGDFGLIMDLKRDSNNTTQDGDSRYLAQEVLNHPPGKPADIFSLGISMLELASDLELPSRGDGWHMLRKGQIPEQFTRNISSKLRHLLSSMMEQDPEDRPTACELYHDPVIQQYLKRRYPQKHNMVHAVQNFWDASLSLLCVILTPLCFPFKYLSEILDLQKLFLVFFSAVKAFYKNCTKPAFRKREVCSLLAKDIDIVDGIENNKLKSKETPHRLDTSGWSHADSTGEAGRNGSNVMKRAPHCERSLRRQFFNDSPTQSIPKLALPLDSPKAEGFPESADRISSADEGIASGTDANQLVHTPTHNTSAVSQIMVPGSPVSSRYELREECVRNIMSAPVRRPPSRFVQPKGFTRIPKLDFSLVDECDKSSATSKKVGITDGREVADRGSSADELDY